jgi:ribosomal protein S18 acetylase RimI-like enzyme
MGQYRYIRVEQTANEADRALSASKYKALRLTALQESPHAFSSTLEIESQFPDDLWISRLSRPGQDIFACIYEDDEGATEWVAQVTVRGPVPASDFELPAESGQAIPSPDEEEEKWQMLSLYTAPGHRGKGLGAQLCQTVFEHLTGRPGASPRIMVRIMVKPDNVATLNLYNRLGFAETGRSTQVEALRANGDGDMIPQGPLAAKYTIRNAIIMALQMERRRAGKKWNK